MLSLLLILTPTIVWIIYDFRAQRRHRKNIGKRSEGNGDLYLVDSGPIPCDDSAQNHNYYNHDIGHGSYHGGDCGGHHGGDFGDCGGHH